MVSQVCIFSQMNIPNAMDDRALLGLGPLADPASQARALQYFESLKSSDSGWQLCINALSSNAYKDDHVKFFCFQIVENFVKTRYPIADPNMQMHLKEFLINWIQQSCSVDGQEKTFLRNKVAQVVALVFLLEYPARWPTFFADILRTLNLGPMAVDAYLRILLAIDDEVVDREIVHTQRETERNTLIKDTMREQCMPELVDSWYRICTTYEGTHPELTCQCLEVIGAYVSWIDINLIANDQFVSAFVRYMSNPLIRESSCDCIHEIISKGMDPIAKTKLVESFIVVLDSAGVLNVSVDEDSDFVSKLGKLVNGIGTSLIISWTKLSKSGDQVNASVAQQTIENKVPLLLRFMSSDYDDVSQSVFDFAREYIQMLKQMPTMTKPQQMNVEALIYVVLKKFKYDESYSFEHEGEDEALFQEYRKQLKVVFDNLAQLDKELFLRIVMGVIKTSLQRWQSVDFREVEATVTFLYMLGEAIPVSHGNHFTASETKASAMHEMMSQLVTCGVVCHAHHAVLQQYFETIVRYEKFFNHEPQHIPDALIAFLDERGLRNPNPKLRSRTAYLFSRFVKCLKSHMQNYTEDILRRLQDLLILSPPSNGVPTSELSADDQLFLFETAGILIISSQFEPSKKQEMMKSLLIPVMSKFDVVLGRLAVETDPERQVVLAECLSHAMAVTSRTSKAFSNQTTMKTCGCVQAYLDALHVFLGSLEVPHQQTILQSAIRQFLHRMVVCLEEEILPYIPTAAECLLKQHDIRSVQEFIPLINQIISKFKKEIVPFLQRVFMPLVKVIFDAINVPFDENDQQAARDKQTLQRNYFLFIAAIVTNNVTDVLVSQDMNDLQQVLLTIIQGAVDFPDPVAQKTCFSVLRKLVELWGGKDGVAGFDEFIYKNIVPACFMAPMKETFDLSDAQTIQALSESALCLKTVLEVRGDEFVLYLQTKYLPTLDMSPQLIQQYCQALKSDSKVFKNYLKVFFQRPKS